MSIKFGKTQKLFIALVLLATVSACAQPPLPQDHFYRLDVAAPAPGGQTLLKGVLEVDRLNADGLLGGRSLLYTEAGKESEIKEYHYHLWTEAPPSLIQDRMVSFLRQANIADNIVTPKMRISPDHIVSGRIRHLERAIGSSTPKIIVELELALKDRKDDRLVFVDTYREVVEHGEDSVIQAVTSMNSALSKIFERFLQDIKNR
jgi:cholesterol transport system auxiliary component